MARKVGQIVGRGPHTWLVRVYNGRDPETQETEITWLTTQLSCDTSSVVRPGGEGGIRTLKPVRGCVSCTFLVAGSAIIVGAAIAHCPELPKLVWNQVFGSTVRARRDNQLERILFPLQTENICAQGDDTRG